MNACLGLLLLFLVLSLPLRGQAPDRVLGTTINVPVPQQDWQKRRAQSVKVIQRSRTGDPADTKAMGALLTEFETHVLSMTPMENLDLIGAFYVPRDGVEKCLPVVVSNCTLGWYDALRFGSASGCAEIANNEGFFARAYTIGGEGVTKGARAFISENPDKVRALVEQGIGLAEKFRKVESYDRKWPSAYGLERLIAAEGGTSERKDLPAAEWDKAWDQAKARVRTFYGLSESGAPGESKYFSDPRSLGLAEAAAVGDTAKIDALIAGGADPNAKGRGAVTVLFWAIVKNNRKSFEDLLMHGADPNIQTTEAYGPIGPGNSVMSLAAMHQNIWYLQEVMKHGGNPNLVNEVRSQTPVVASLYSMRTENARLLVLAGANLKWQDRDGDTPLLSAAAINQYEAVHFMLEAGADPSIADKMGVTLSDRIRKSRLAPGSEVAQWRQKVIDLLKAKGVEVDLPAPPRT